MEQSSSDVFSDRSDIILAEHTGCGTGFRPIPYQNS